MQNLTILILKNDTILITEYEPVESEIGGPDCLLTNPVQMLVTDSNTYDMKRWISFTDDRKFKIHSDFILTMAEPKPDQIELYLKTIK